MLRRARGHGRTIAVTVPVADPAWNLPALAAAANRIILIAYDEHWQTGTPGPTASQAWFGTVVALALAQVPHGNAIIAVASCGYDWPADGPATVLSVDQARALAACMGVTPFSDGANGAHYS